MRLLHTGSVPRFKALRVGTVGGGGGGGGVQKALWVYSMQTEHLETRTHTGVNKGRGLFIELGVMGILESIFLLMKSRCSRAHSKDKQLRVKGLRVLTP